MASRAKPRRTSLDVGTAFERHALRYLNDGLYMDLRRVGGAGDGGIDLRGWWWLPRREEGGGPARSEADSSSYHDLRRVRVVVQCKAEKKSLGPRAVREMEGVMSGLTLRLNRLPPDNGNLFPISSPTSHTTATTEDAEQSLTEEAIAVLCSQSGFTKSSMVHATSSHIPLMLVHLPGGQPDDAPSPDLPEVKVDQGDAGGGVISDIRSDSSTDTMSSAHLPSPSVADIEVMSVWWNRALSDGVLGGGIELRRTMGLAGVGVGLWMDGRRLGRCAPGIQ